MNVHPSTYFKVQVLDENEVSTRKGEPVVVVNRTEELKVMVKRKGAVTWEPVTEDLALVDLKKMPQMEVKRMAQVAYQEHLGDRWVTYAALYLPIILQGEKSQGYTEPLWGFWRVRNGT